MGQRAVVIIDCFIHSYEREAVAVRLCELADVVTLHVAAQGVTTFRHEPRYVEEIPGENVVNVAVSFLPQLSAFECEQILRDQALEHARMIAAERYPNETALFIVADGDEIPHPHSIVDAAYRSLRPSVLLTDYREWFMDWRAPEPWQLEHQPIIGTYAQIQAQGGATAARYRCREWAVARPRGWHLSTLGDAGLAARKLSTFAHTEYDTPEWNDEQQLARFRATGRDLLDRFDLERTGDLPSCAPSFPHLLAPIGAGHAS